MLVNMRDYQEVTGDLSTPYNEVNRLLLRYQTLAENYIERELEAKTILKESHYYIGASSFMVKRYPIIDLVCVYADGSAFSKDNLMVDKQTGIIYHDGLLSSARLVQVSYKGGYEEAPSDLKQAICTLVHANINDEIDGFRPVKRETVYGVTSIDYDVPKTDVAFPELGTWRVVFDRYKRPYEMGIA